PHLSTHIAVVHNGIIENYESLRNLLIHRGYNFTSETDTEVIAHLIHWQQQQQAGSLLEVMQLVVAQLSGTYAVVVMD
ncbi:MAG: glutamine--fructose-6-phosphate aminotransferase, partial [Candidatus Regiella insecticola]|nr:glutamine--fructose-6-phosphate aminotransferase [Candidatus Regiella insecticola]